MLPDLLPAAVARPVAKGSELVRGALGSLTWAPAVGIAKRAIEGVFSQIEIGSLVVVDEPSHTRRLFGHKPITVNGYCNGYGVNGHSARDHKPDGPHAELVIKRDAFWMRLFLFADMGFAEAFMLGDFECDDLTTFFQLFIVNREQMGNGTTRFSMISGAISSLARTTNTLSNSLLNISAHYDISNEMFAAFLSPDMTYSCPIWSTRRDRDDGEETLEEAQMTKLIRFIDGARIKPTDHVLEIGTGWGSFAIEAVRRTGCRITSLTLSENQKALAEARIAEAGFSDRVEVMLMDYRELPVPEKPYDKIVSIEMLEAVGREYLGTYFARIDQLLKRDGGIAMFQCITIPEGRYEAYSRSKDFINHYIFPGGHLPSITQLLSHISEASRGTLVVEQVENIGGHYTKTLRLWRESFLDNFKTDIRPSLKREHGGMTSAEVEVFKRKWEYYFTYCEAAFLTKTLGDVIITVGREGAMELMEGIPI